MVCTPPRMRRYCNTLQYRNTRTSMIRFIVCCCFIGLLLILHFVVLPIASGAYNDECYLEPERLKDLRYAIQSIAVTLSKYNVTYWLDYGTLLGAVQRGDVLPWDGDADISFLRAEENYNVHMELLKKYGINSNGLLARYKGLSIDYVRWEEKLGSYDGLPQIILHKYYPESVLKNENILVAWNHKLDSFPKTWVTPRNEVAFHGVRIAVPSEYAKVLHHRYPFTYSIGLSVPYKWKCYVPCWIHHARGC